MNSRVIAKHQKHFRKKKSNNNTTMLYIPAVGETLREHWHGPSHEQSVMTQGHLCKSQPCGSRCFSPWKIVAPSLTSLIPSQACN